MLLQQPIDVLLVHRQILAIFQVSPHPPIAPRGMIGLELLDARQQLLIALGHADGALPAHHPASSLFFSSTVNSPTNVLSRRTSSRRRCSVCSGPPRSKTLV